MRVLSEVLIPPLDKTCVLLVKMVVFSFQIIPGRMFTSTRLGGRLGL